MARNPFAFIAPLALVPALFGCSASAPSAPPPLPPEALAAVVQNPGVSRDDLARARITTGDVAGGLADWRALLADVPPGEDRAGLEREIDATAKAGDRVEGIDRALPPLPHRDAARRWLTDNVPLEKRGWLRGA